MTDEERSQKYWAYRNELDHVETDMTLYKAKVDRISDARVELKRIKDAMNDIAKSVKKIANKADRWAGKNQKDTDEEADSGALHSAYSAYEDELIETLTELFHAQEEFDRLYNEKFDRKRWLEERIYELGDI